MKQLSVCFQRQALEKYFKRKVSIDIPSSKLHAFVICRQFGISRRGVINHTINPSVKLAKLPVLCLSFFFFSHRSGSPTSHNNYHYETCNYPDRFHKAMTISWISLQNNLRNPSLEAIIIFSRAF